MSINRIETRDFRGLDDIHFQPANINLITGHGKTSFLDAIAYADSTDHQLHALLRESYRVESSKLSLADLVRLNFFTHKKELESFGVQLFLRGGRSRRFEIWRTDEGTNESIHGRGCVKPPFIFVCDSIEPVKIPPRAIHYAKMATAHKEYGTSPDSWPLNYIGANRVSSAELLQKHCQNAHRTTAFRETLALMIKKGFMEGISIDMKDKAKGLMIKTDDRDSRIPLYSCPDSMVRIMTILVFLNSDKRNYFLIDNIEQYLTDEELEWLIPEVCKSAERLGKQLFVTTKINQVADLLNKYAETSGRSLKHLDLVPSKLHQKESVT